MCVAREGGSHSIWINPHKRPIISTLAQAMLAKYGTLIRAKSGAVRLTRA